VTVWDVALKDWPKAMLPTTALKADSSFEGMVLRHPVREGQPLLSVQLVRDGATLPAAVVAALPPVSQPAAGQTERFVPAPPADPPVAAVVAPPENASASAPVVEPVAPADTTASASATQPAAIATSSSPVDDPAPQADVVVALPAVAAANGSLTDIDSAVAADAGVPADAGRAEPAEFAVPTMVAIVPAAAAPVETEPTPTAATATPSAVADAAPLAAPVPALPSTDLERSLAQVGVSRTESADAGPSVLDRTSAPESPAPQQSTPKLHLVVPERIALAVDASFTQQPNPVAVAGQDPAVPTRGRSPAAMAAGTAPSGKTAAANPVTRKPQAPARQPAAKPATKPQPAQARGLGAWFPQFSGGSRQR
jgi:hypothetical protein